MNLIAGLWWLPEEVRRLSGVRENEMLAEVESWGARLKERFSWMLNTSCDSNRLYPSEFLAMADWCIAEIEPLVSSPNQQ